jgi:tellurite resistance protein
MMQDPMSRPRRRYRITANLFGIPLGLCGLAQCWTSAANLDVTPLWTADVLWAMAAVAWLVIALAYFGRYHRPTDLARELADSKFGPFISVAAIVPMLLGAAITRHEPIAGHVLFWTALIVTLLLGGWLIGQWILSPPALPQWHPGYFLPTVGGGLIGAVVATGIGERSLGQLLFGYGVISWIVLAPIIRLRLFTAPALPVPLRSTLAIELAPPVIAGISWFELNGGQVDLFSFFLAGYAFLIVIVQVRLVPLYRRIPFGPAWWAFSFPYAAAAGYTLRWLGAEHVSSPAAWTWLLLIITTGAAAVLVIRSAAALVGRRFLLTSTEPQPSPDSRAHRPPSASGEFDLPTAHRHRSIQVGDGVLGR